MMRKMDSSTIEKASEYFEKGYNCCESVFYACCEDLGIELNEQSKRLATGFGGGLGGAGCTCGALSGAVMVASLVKGRSKPLEESKDPSYALAKELRTQFKGKYGTTCCVGLKKGDDRSICRGYVSGTVEILSNLLK